MSCKTCSYEGSVESLPCCEICIDGKIVTKVTSWEAYGTGFVVNTEKGPYYFGLKTTFDGDRLNSSDAVQWAKDNLTNCCGGDEDPPFEFVSVSHFDLCLNGSIVKFEACKDETGVTVYTGSDGSAFGSYAEIFAAGYTTECVEKEFIDTQWYTDNNENVPDCDKTPIAIDRYFDGTNWCYEFTGNSLGTDNLNINNYTMLGDFNLGSVKINDPVCVCAFIQYSAPVGGGDVAKSRADILADIIAKVGLTAPTGTSWDLQTAKIAVYSKGTDVTDFTSQSEDTTTINADADVTCGGKKTTINVNGGQIPFGNDPLDLDCDGESDNLLPADFAVEFDEGSAVGIYACVTPVA